MFSKVSKSLNFNLPGFYSLWKWTTQTKQLNLLVNGKAGLCLDLQYNSFYFGWYLCMFQVKVEQYKKIGVTFPADPLSKGNQCHQFHLYTTDNLCKCIKYILQREPSFKEYIYVYHCLSLHGILLYGCINLLKVTN